MTISGNHIIIKASVMQNHAILHVSWKLLRACNYKCQYCPDSAPDDNIVLDKKNILNMARRILEFPQPFKDIYLCGGEPALHPFLPDIIRYLLAPRGKTAITLATNGGMDAQFYLNLSKGASPEALKFEIFIHPAFADLKHLLMLTAFFAERHHPVNVRIACDPQRQNKVENFYNSFARLRKVVPFNMRMERLQDLAYAKEQSAWIADLEQRVFAMGATDALPEPAGAERHSASGNENVSDAQPDNNFKGYYCCLGTNFLHIEPDGSFYGSTCGMASENMRLWQAGNNFTASIATVVRCPLDKCSGGLNLFLPKFENEDLALAWLDDYKKSASEIAWDIPADSGNLRPALATIVRSRLKNLLPSASDCQDKIMAMLDILRGHFESIVKTYAALGDEYGRELFLRAIKALETGNAGYMLPAEDKAIKAKSVAGMSPVLRISLPQAAETMLNIPRLLELCYPGHPLYARKDEADSLAIILHAAQLPYQTRHSSCVKCPAVSVIVVSHDSEKTIRRCLDSILVQNMRDLEIVIADYASSDGTSEIIENYANAYAGIVRSIRFGEQTGYGKALDSALRMASGQYVAFLDANDMFSANFLERGIRILEEKQAEIAAFEILEIAPDCHEHLWSVAEGEYSGQQALEMLLLEKTGNYTPAGRVFRMELLERCQAEFGDTGDSLNFMLAVHLAAKKMAVTSGLEYYHYKKHAFENSGGYNGFNAFINAVAGIDAFFDRNSLDKSSLAYSHCIRKVYRQNRDRIFATINNADKENRLAGLFKKDLLLKLASCAELLRNIIADYALAFCRSKGLWPEVAAEDLDWRSAATESLPPGTFQAYADADQPAGPAPVLSVIMPNYNKADCLDACLESALSQSLYDFELIIVDDCSDDGGYELLQAYADIHPRIRLYRMERNSLQGVCRNIGIDKARGSYLIFVDSDDLCLPGYFDFAVRTIRDSDADLAIFSIEHLDQHGSVTWRNLVPDGSISRNKAIHEFFKGSFEPAPWGKIYKAKTVSRLNCRFVEHVLHQDVPFFFEVLCNARSVVTRNRTVYQYVASANSSLRAASAKWIQIHSVCVFQDNMRKAMERVYGRDNDCHADMDLAVQSLWNIENVLLDKCRAFLEATGELPFVSGDLRLLQNNPLFISALLAGFSRFRSKNPDFAEGIFEPEKPAGHLAQTCAVSPIASIIIIIRGQPRNMASGIESALSQSLRDIEIIIIDDSASEAGHEFLRAYAARDRRLVLRRNDSPKGAAYCGRLGLDMARGKYAAFVQCDTRLPSDFLLSSVAILERDNMLDYVQSATNGNQSLARLRHNGKELLAAFCKDGLSHWSDWAKVYRKEFLSGNSEAFCKAMADADALMLNVYANTGEAMELNQPEFEGIAHASENECLCLAEAVEALNAVAGFFRRMDKDFSKNFRQKFLSSKWRGLLKFLMNDPENPLNDCQTPGLFEYFMPDSDIMEAMLRDLAELSAKTGYAESALPQILNFSTGMSPLELVPVCAGGQLRHDPVLSLIIYVRDSANSIAECLASIRADMAANVEIILVDDSSLDESQRICAAWTMDTEGASLFRTPWRAGKNAAFNLAMRQSAGKYLLFMNSGERLAPSFLYRGLTVLKQSPPCEAFVFKREISGAKAGLTNSAWPDSCPLNARAALMALAGMNDMSGCASLCGRDFLMANAGLRHSSKPGDTLFTLCACAKARDILFADTTAIYLPENKDRIQKCDIDDPETGLDNMLYADNLVSEQLLNEKTDNYACSRDYDKLMTKIYDEKDLDNLLNLLHWRMSWESRQSLFFGCARAAINSRFLFRLMLTKYKSLLNAG